MRARVRARVKWWARPVPPREARDEESEARSVDRQAEGAELEVPPAEAERQRVAVPAQQAREEEAPHESNRVRLIVAEHLRTRGPNLR